MQEALKPKNALKGPLGLAYGWWVIISIAYIIMPYDLLPDIIPVIGWTDDTGMLGFGIYCFMRWWKARKRVQ